MSTSGPSFQDIQAMSELVGMMDDIEQGSEVRPTLHNNQTSIPNDLLSICTPDTSGDKQAMLDILSSLDSVSGEYNVPKQVQKKQPSVNSNTNDLYAALYQEAQMNQNTGSYNEVPDYVPVNNATHHSSQYFVLSEGYKGTKLKQYNIKCSGVQSPIACGIMVEEAANGLCALLNEGVPITDRRVIGVLSLALQYNSLFESTFKCIQKRKQVLKEYNYDVAKEMDYKITSGKSQADVVKRDLILFLMKENITYK